MGKGPLYFYSRAPLEPWAPLEPRAPTPMSDTFLTSAADPHFPLRMNDMIFEYPLTVVFTHFSAV